MRAIVRGANGDGERPPMVTFRSAKERFSIPKTVDCRPVRSLRQQCAVCLQFPFSSILLIGATSMSNNIARELTSIIIPVWNQLEFTQQCLASLKEHTRPAWELIVIDNGSDDGTAAYLAGVRDMASVPVTVVTNTKNLGFPAAVNQGLRLARGEYLVLMNNDVVVTDGWLDQLIGLVNAKRGPGAERAGASRDASADMGGRRSVDTGAGSGDPRTAPAVPRVGDESGSECASTCAFETRAGDGTWPTPPGPPFTRGGKVMVPPSVDQAGAAVEIRVGDATGPTPLAPPSQGGERMRSTKGVHLRRLQFAPLGSLGPCPTLWRRRSLSRVCLIAMSTRCTGSPGSGVMSIASSGSPCSSFQGFVCS